LCATTTSQVRWFGVWGLGFSALEFSALWNKGLVL
jgi:hypothetical protein